MPSNHLILCRPLLLLPSIFPSIKVFSNESFQILSFQTSFQILSLKLHNWLQLSLFVLEPSLSHYSEFSPITHRVFPENVTVHTVSPRIGTLFLAPPALELPRYRGTSSPSKPSVAGSVGSLMAMSYSFLGNLIISLWPSRADSFSWVRILKTGGWPSRILIFLSIWNFFISKAYIEHHTQLWLEYFKRHYRTSPVV